MRQLFIVLALMLLVTPQARAEVPESAFIYASGQGALLIPFDTSESAQIGYGLGAGVRLSRYWSVGAFLYHTSQTVKVINTSTTVDNYVYGAEGTYSIKTWSEFPWLNVGFKLGFVNRNFGSNASILGLPVSEAITSNDYVMGVKVGCEYTFDFGMGIGGELDSFYDVTASIASPVVLLTTIRFWF